MNKRLFARLAWTAIASPLLMMLAYEMNGTGFAWLAVPFYEPGLFIAGMVFPGGVHSGRAELYIQVAFGLNFVFIWIVLLVVLRLLEKFIAQGRTKAAN